MSSSTAHGGMLSNRRINEINAHIGKTIRPALYLAAYYAPKSYPADGNNESMFWCAATNAYGLFRDCMPKFYSSEKKLSLLGIFKGYNVLTEEIEDKIKNCIDLINALRSVYCHNANPTVSSDAKKKIRKVYSFFKECIPDFSFEDIEDEDFFILPNFSSEQWECCYESISKDVECCLDSLCGIIDTIACDSKKSEITAKWENLLAEWIINGNFTFTAIKSKLAGQEKFVRRGKNPPNGTIESEIKQLKNEVAKSEGMEDKTECMIIACSRIINSMKAPALPYDVIAKLYDMYV